MPVIEIKMPQLFSSNDEGKIARWLVREGQQIEAGDIIAEVETDEAAVEIEAIEGGKITRLIVAAGSPPVKVNTPIAMLDQDGVGVRYDSPPPATNRLATSGGSPAATPPPAASPAASTALAPGAPAPEGVGLAARSRTRLMASNPGPAVSEYKGATAMRPPVAKTQFLRSDAAAESAETDPVAGWVVVVKGPGRGGFRPVYVGMNSVGRDPSQRISLSFGDESISREEHAFITYDEEQRRFYLQHGGKANLVRLGKQPVLVPTELKPNDLIRVGRTTLRFVGCCGPDFSWTDEVKEA
jgi:hypothetical protein